MKLIIVLIKYPIIGAFSSLGGAILLFIQNILIPLQIIGGIVGIGVGAITFYAKWLEIKDKKKNEDSDPK